MARKLLPTCELFAGVGGMTLGAARAGLDVKVAVEIDRRAAAAHHKNFPKTVSSDIDVSTLAGRKLMDLAGLRPGQLTGLIGGPPCQGFSSMGRRHVGDSRNSLFAHFFRLVRETRPTFFVAENVTGILDPRYQHHIEGAFGALKHLYHLTAPFIATASDFGAPTSRRRVFFVGVSRRDYLSGVDAETLLDSDADEVVVKSALRGLPVTVESNWHEDPLGKARLHPVAQTWFQERLFNARPAGVGHQEALQMLDGGYVLGHQGTLHSKEISERYGRLEAGEADPITKSVRLWADGFCPTLRAGTDRERGAFQAVRPIHYKQPRVITPREAARLQSFPDWFVFDQTKWHSFRQIGNSVPPLLAESIFANLRRALSI